MFVVLAPSGEKESSSHRSLHSNVPTREELTSALAMQCNLCTASRSDLERNSPAWLLEALQDVPSGARVYKISSVKSPQKVGDSDGEEMSVAELKAQVESLKREKADLHVKLKDAVGSVKSFHAQQRKLYDGFKILRAKYDDLKAESAVTMWEYIPSKVKGFEQLGDTNVSIFESASRIGDYKIGKLLGEGQFADVKLATCSKSSTQLAVKIMRKDRVHSVQALKRIQNELAVLRMVDHENIVTFHDVILSTKFVYLFVEQGGEDLFEFFDQHLEGVDQRIAQEIILGITLPIAYLHKLQICHRDLKPENILLKQIPGRPITSSVIQICDFGLCCQKVKPRTKSLSEFCGSPGFFAPEMVLGGGKYNGLLVDVWSIGCIMLELSLGHDIFCKSWMSAYDFDIIQRPSAFEDAIDTAVSDLKLELMNEEMVEFIRKVLVIDPSKRISSEEMLDLSWFRGHSKVSKKRRYQSESMQSLDLEAKMEPLSEFKSSDDQVSEPNSPMFAFGIDDEEIPAPTHESIPMPMAEAKSDNSNNSSENDLVALNKAKTRMISDEAKFSDYTSRSASPMSPTELKGRASLIETDDDDDGQSEKFKDSLSLRARRHFSKSNPITVDTKVTKKYSSVAGLTTSNPNAGTSGGSLVNNYVSNSALGGLSHGVDSSSPPAHLTLNLPPIDPQTPSLRSAKKTYKSGVSLLREVDADQLLLSPDAEKGKSPSLQGRTYSSSSDVGAEEKRTR
mmetsp:Transcript_28657/g.57332  ORF Transcript_28657/g.57332 Transcript_28657/m.57332 type:complete len:736 (+) Transcript_28657:30-2237(+)|eukprot:CAMPEP_0182486694 /NCGR_PEP_ID=MMETSP1319-20130603/47526_1 /TAXON_ID=172717 /ORGANISM="Bolidomonas pacifica, Strain RCC208" /LENGTH=735 /DNA_ID=CAMNT_0024688797 /DNA_START=574 /DNA_END=2781 /DNA_ORIENTATION=+